MEDIAIISISSLFPGAKSPDELWQKLLEEQDCRSEATVKQMGVDPKRYYGKKGDDDKYYCMNGGYITDFDFNPNGYLVNADYLAAMDDLHQWVLHTGKQVLDQAGYWGSESLNRTGVIMGNLSFPTKNSNHLFMPLYHQVVNDALQENLQANFSLSNFTEPKTIHADNGLIAGYPIALLAKACGLGGSHFALDAACASSCYALKLASDYLQTGKADMMLAGAVSASDPMFVNMGFSIFQAYPGNNISAPLDTRSQGLFAGEGAGMMLLKRHSDAVRDGDQIQAIIKGAALSNDGKGEFVLSPNTKGQVLVYERAYEDAQVSPADVSYVECHATGTPKGDRVELGSMETFFSRTNSKPMVGSVKSNLGHLLTAAGMPGVTKAIYSLNEKTIPATINIEQPNSSKTDYFSGNEIVQQTMALPQKACEKAKAAVSVFGFGGANAHVVLEEPHQQLRQKSHSVKAKEPMAIIGMDAHFGSANNLQAVAKCLQTKSNAFTYMPATRSKALEQNPFLARTLGLSNQTKAAFIDDFEIDFLRYKIPPNEKDCLIPQQLLMMQTADNAAKDAGLKEGANVAVLVAMGVELELHQYRGRVNLATQIEDTLRNQGVQLSAEEKQSLTDITKDAVASAAQLNQYTSFIGNIMASRISALWDFSGPAFTISAEENSVYRCVELAESLFQTSDVEAVIIAGVDLAGSIENISLRQNTAPKFTALAEGYSQNVLDQAGFIPSDMAGSFVLKPQSALSGDDKAKQYAQIDAINISADFSAQGVVQNLEQVAGDKLAELELIEAHASGFAKEMDIERTALPQVQAKTAGAQIDSSKRAFGHGFAASGVASIISHALHQNFFGRVSLINGLGRDESCAALRISSPGNKRALGYQVAPNVKQRPQLLKRVQLGGPSIAENIKQGLQSLPQGIKQSIESKLSAATQANQQTLDVSNIATPFVSESSTQTENISIDHPQTSGEPVVDKTPKVISSAAAVTATPVNPAPVPTSNTQQQLAGQSAATASLQNQALSAHKAFLENRKAAQDHMSRLIQNQAGVANVQLNAIAPAAIAATASHASPAQIAAPVTATVAEVSAPAAPFQGSTSVFDTDSDELSVAEKMSPGIVLTDKYNKPNNVIFDEAALVEFAEGDIGKVFGPEYDIIDSYSRRVRLPTTDYLLVTRVTDLEAKTNEYKPCYMATEYDIPMDAPFLIDGQIPWSVSVESGQCDLMLISYLGIDFQCKGERVYRLLDCELTFLEDMAFGGETLRYEIKIDSFARNGDQFLFFFHYDCFVGDKKVLIMRNGCAGFFTDEELDDGKGVILNDKDKAQLASAVKSSFTPLIANTRTQYDYQDMMKLVRGDIAGCFGPEYDQGGRNPSLKFSSKKFLMIERVTKIDRSGGHWGLGLLEGQKDLEPEHWYFPCHFKDDEVMAGSLMSEGCGQLAMFFMLWLGMHSNVNNARFQPVPGEAQTVRCRGQVTPQSNTLTYRMEVTEMGMNPAPYMKANIDIILDGKVVVDFKNLSVMIKEQDASSLYAADLPPSVQLVNDLVSPQAQQALAAAVSTSSSELDETGKAPFANVNAPLMWVESDKSAPLIKGVTPIKHKEAPMPSDPARQNRVPDTVPYTPWHMFEFATGNISNCFGPEFDVYEGRIPPRTPCGDLQVVTQVIDVQGKRGDLKKVSSCVAEYEVPVDAWYFAKNSHENWMPYSVLMEISLQPNGFISGYMGTTLQYPDKDLFFRNLDGRGTLLKEIDLRGKTITNKSVMLSTSQAGGSIIQSFTFELLADGETFYEGSAVFGYFSGDALTNQLGIDNGRTTNPWFVDNNTPQGDIEVLDLRDQNLALYTAPQGKPHYKLAGGQLNFVDTVSIVEGGGSEGKGYIYGERTIDPTDWFFRYHFHQDPVMPGSLGVEAIIELLQSYALKNDLGAGFTNPRFIAPMTEVVWKYRGQITPINKKMELDVHVKDIIREDGRVTIVGDANLSKDGLRIYQVMDIVLSIVEA